ncbi:hypothetical protein Ade02nite_55640 [Paractinoplanes deccanensis]|uniref:Metallo-beta-lactamase domain-containing protein n=1 Tax=Paractinoplanes deccanensis TaxID=113561 RepID=A0ABQ3YAD3_9ACTN|nr:MBL fold metallo-hydrolase [Actinoplanes deccanensis]GID76923.1 hypothetical protein Ade02nite_55640 [Actinoplanes deccanensis]
MAVSGDGKAWYLLNASPDIRTQLIGTPALRPGPGLRETPIRGVLLTTAELDHTIGLLSLREAVSLTVYATSTVIAALAPMRAMLAAYTNVEWRDLPDMLDLDGGLTVDRLTVGTKRPRYAAGVDGNDWVSALRLYAPAAPRSDRIQTQRMYTKLEPDAVRSTAPAAAAPGDGIQTQRMYTELERDAVRSTAPAAVAPGEGIQAQRMYTKPDRDAARSTAPAAAARGDEIQAQRMYTDAAFVYATCLPIWSDQFDDFVAGAAGVLVDGTFGTDDELTRMTGRPGSAASMGHMPMVDSRPYFARHPGTRFWYGHLNNTNDAQGADVVEDGIELF